MRRSILTLTIVGLLVIGLVAPAVAAPKRAPAPGQDSIATIAGTAGFSELVGALVYVDEELGTDLVGLFSTGTDQYTVFAPTDQAFGNLLGDAEITDLPAQDVLDVLLYHVVEGRRAANSVVPPVQPRSIATLQGSPLTVTSAGMIQTTSGQEAGFVGPDLIDVTASNGIIHAVDTVLVP